MADTGRTGVIWVKSGSTNIAKITVNQAPGVTKYFYFDSNSATTTASTVTSGITVATCAYITNYDNLTYSVSESWITAVNFNDGTLTATFTTNPDTNNRSSVITIKGNGTNVGTFTVTQEAKYDPAPVGTITFTYYTDEEYWDSSNPFYCSNYFTNTFGPAKIYVDGNYLRDVTIDDVVGYETWGAKYDGDWTKSDSFWRSRIWMDGNAGRDARGEEGVFTHATGSVDTGVQLGAIVNLWGTEYKLFMCAIRYYGG